jgi:hypothetical protein
MVVPSWSWAGLSQLSVVGGGDQFIKKGEWIDDSRKEDVLSVVQKSSSQHCSLLVDTLNLAE